MMVINSNNNNNANFGDLIGSETLTNTNLSTFDNKNVGSNKTVTVNSITLSDGTNGGLASNYSIIPGQTTANITAKTNSNSICIKQGL